MTTNHIENDETAQHFSGIEFEIASLRALICLQQKELMAAYQQMHRYAKDLRTLLAADDNLPCVKTKDELYSSRD